LIEIGTPSSGECAAPRARRASLCAAAPSAPASSSATKLFSRPSPLRMRARLRSTSAFDDRRPAASAAASSAIDSGFPPISPFPR